MQKKASRKSNAIYHFFEEVQVDASKQKGAPGDKHYKCWHGSRTTITIKKSLKYNVQSEFQMPAMPVTTHLESRAAEPPEDKLPDAVPAVYDTERARWATDG